MWPLKARNMYVCFLSNPQHGDIAEMLEETPVDSPSAKALSSARCMLVVPNR